jgi:hypothetical protein
LDSTAIRQSESPLRSRTLGYRLPTASQTVMAHAHRSRNCLVSAHTPRDRDTGACKLAPRLQGSFTLEIGDTPALGSGHPPFSIVFRLPRPSRALTPHPAVTPPVQSLVPKVLPLTYTAGPGEGCVGSKLDGKPFFSSLAKCRGCWEGSQSQTDLPCSMHTLRLLEEGAQRKRCRPQVSI